MAGPTSSVAALVPPASPEMIFSRPTVSQGPWALRYRLPRPWCLSEGAAGTRPARNADYQSIFVGDEAEPDEVRWLSRADVGELMQGRMNRCLPTSIATTGATQARTCGDVSHVLHDAT
jgi:hypothetical protein